MADLRHIIDDLKLTAEDPDEPEDESGHEFREKRPKFIPEYLSTKHIICSVCSRQWTVVIYFEGSTEVLLHPLEANCSFCTDRATEAIRPSPGSHSVFHIGEHAKAYYRLLARPTCNMAKLDSVTKEITYIYNDGSTVVMTLR